MFKKATLQANLPQPDHMDRLNKLWVQAVRHNDSGDRLGEFDKLCVDLNLAKDGVPLVFEDFELTVYIGTAKGRLVFAIMICDDVPRWLRQVFGADAEHAQEGGESEAVYVIAPPVPGALVDVWMVMPDRGVEAYWPQTETELLPLLAAVGL